MRISFVRTALRRTHRSISQPSQSQRISSANLRTKTVLQISREALSTEASSLRYVNYLGSSAEESVLRGWDDGVACEDDDGT